MNPTGIQTLEDAKKVSAICALNGNVHDEFLKNNGFTNVFRSHSYISLLFMAEGYLAFSKNVPADVVRQWQAALDQLKKSGKYDQLVKDYYLSE